MIWLLLSTVLSVFLVVKWRQSYWQRRGVPCPPYHFFYGHIKDLAMDRISQAETNLLRYNEAKKSGSKFVGFYFFLFPVLTILDLNLVKQIMIKDFDHFSGHGMYHHPRDILTMHLFNLEGERWRKLRDKLSPTFTTGKIKLMFDVMLEKSQTLEKVVEKLSITGPFGVKEILCRFTTDVIVSTAFGIECNSLEEPENVIRKYGKKIFDYHPINLWLQMVIPWKILGFLGFKISGKEVTNFFTKLAENAIKIRDTTAVGRKDFLHLLLQLRSINGSEKLSKDEIIAQCFAFFMGGFETTATLMTFALFELSKNQNVQQKLRNEILQTLDRYQGKITYEAVKEMSYLDQVIHGMLLKYHPKFASTKVFEETLRKFPPVTSLPRSCTKDYRIPGTKIVISKGSRVEIPTWGIHMDPDYYPEPEKFDPERFSNANKATRSNLSYLPFGEGPRTCIGLRFGILESKIGLVTLLRRFQLTLSGKTKIPIQIDRRSLIISIKGDVWIQATKI